MKRFKFKSVVQLANIRLSVKTAAVVLASSTMVSALLGLFRDRLLNSYYLGTYPTGIDAYTAAFTVPDFMFFILTSGALAVSFIPVFNHLKRQKQMSSPIGYKAICCHRYDIVIEDICLVAM